MAIVTLSACATTPKNNLLSDQNCKPVYKQVYQPPLKLGGSGRVRQVFAYKNCSSSDSGELVSTQRVYELVNLSQSHDKKRLNAEISNFLAELIESDKSVINIDNVQRDLRVLSQYLKFQNESFFSLNNVQLEECEPDKFVVSGEVSQGDLIDCHISKNSQNSSMLYDLWYNEHDLIFNFLYLSGLYKVESVSHKKYYEHWRQTFGKLVIENSCYREQYCSMGLLSYLVELQMLYLEYLYDTEDVWRKSIERLVADRHFLDLYASSKFSKFYPEIFAKLNPIISKYRSE